MFAEICLALTVYWEARNQPVETQIAIAQVVMNRTDHENFPNTVCAVVQDGPHIFNFPLKNKCQFKWYCDGRPDDPKEAKSWDQSRSIARLILRIHPMQVVSLPGDTLYFHSHKWDAFPSKNYVEKIGDFQFYTEKY
jgi:spore germination cell wall hydrolase CwlJ-like protein